jgi:3-isopropylmalate/(R)-2-methylmalate dehydratase small subunit
VTGKNFGCGSSREHAPWALADWGFRALIAPSFADIFANNCLKNGLLPVVLSEEETTLIIKRALTNQHYTLTIDLEQTSVTDSEGFATRFSIDGFSRHCLLEGLDDISLTLEHEEKIAEFESHRPLWL